MTLEQFKDKYGERESREHLMILTEKVNNENDKIFVFMPTDNKIGKQTIRDYLNILSESDVKDAIIIIKNDITSYANKFVNSDPIKNKYNIELLYQNDLISDYHDFDLENYYCLNNKKSKIVNNKSIDKDKNKEKTKKKKKKDKRADKTKEKKKKVQLTKKDNCKENNSNINININSCSEENINNDHDMYVTKKVGNEKEVPRGVMSSNDNYNSDSDDEPPKKRLRLSNSNEKEKKQN